MSPKSSIDTPISSPSARPAPLRGILAVVLLLLATATFLPDRNSLTTFHETNASVRLYQAQALASFGEWHVRSMLCRYGPHHDTLDLSLDAAGRPVPNKAPGMTALAVPVLEVWSPADGPVPHQRALRLLALLFSLLPVLAAAWWMLRWARDAEWYASAGVALFAWLGASGMFNQVGLFQDYALASALLLVAAFAWIRPRSPSLAQGAGVGALLGAAFAVNYAFAWYGAIVIAMPVLVAAVRDRRQWRAWRRALSGAVLGGIPFVLAVLAYHHHVFGSPWTTPYAHLRDLGLQQDVATAGFSLAAVAGYWVEPKSGLLWFAPWVPVGLVGLMQMARSHEHRERGFGAAGVGVLAATWVFFSYWHATNPDDAAFSRHALPAMGFCAVGLAHIWQRWRGSAPGRVGIATVTVLLAGGFLHQWVTAWAFPYHPHDVRGALWSIDWPLFVDGIHVRPWSWVQPTTSEPQPQWLPAGISAAAGFVALGLAVRAAGRLPIQRPAVRWARIVVAGVLGAAWFAAGFEVGVTADDASRQARREQTELDQAAALVRESSFVPEGAGWRAEGYSSNKYCAQERAE